MTQSSYPEGVVIRGAAPAEASVVCVFVHGRTQSPADMIEQVTGPLAAPGRRFVHPKSAGEGWWEARAVDPLTDAARAQLEAAVSHLHRVIEIARAQAPQARLVLGGFSQGACLSMEYLMREGGWSDGAACLLTGCRLGVADDDRPIRDLDGMPIYASCKSSDPWIPVANFIELSTTLAQSGARLRTDLFPGDEHSITATERAALGAILDNVAKDKPALEAEGCAR